VDSVHPEKDVYVNVTHETNQNLIAPWKKLLPWNKKFGHAGFKWNAILAIRYTRKRKDFYIR
jgi:hypothetical protein